MKDNPFGLNPMKLPQISQLDPDIKKSAEIFSQMTDRAFRDIFKGEIRGAFLTEMKNKVSTAIVPILFNLYDFNFTQERIATGRDGTFDYEICKIIIGIHHANTIFLTKEEANVQMRNPEYREQLLQQAVNEVFLRRYAAAFFRNQSIMLGERYIYYPVPYMLFVFCMRMNEIFSAKGASSQSSALISLIMNKSMAALSLIEDGFLDSAYMPCRAVIEMYAKLMLLRTDARLFAIADRFAYYDLDKTNCSKQYSDEYNNLFENRIARSCKNKVDYMHYGFVDAIDGYHEIVNQNPYSIYGIFAYLKSQADDNKIQVYEQIENLYQSCHGYTHGNVTKARFPLLHYFELSLILGFIVPQVYEIACEEAGLDKQIGFDLLEQFKKDFELLKKQYQERSTENFEMESGKYTYFHRQ